MLTSSAIAWSAVTAPLFTADRAEAAMLRHWGAHDARRLAVAMAWGVSDEANALAELSATLAGHAQRARIHSVSCRALAADMLDDETGALAERHNAVRQRMIEAATRVLRDKPADRLGAALAAADIARAENVPHEMVDTAFNLALWRAKRRA